MDCVNEQLLLEMHNEIVELYKKIISSSKTLPSKPEKNYNDSNSTRELIDIYYQEMKKYNETIRKYNMDIISFSNKIVKYLEMFSIKNSKKQRSKLNLCDLISERFTINKCLEYYYDKNNDIRILEKREKELKDQENQKKYKELQIEAAKWLIDRGKKYGEDFTEETAIEIADHVALHETVETMKKNLDFISFSGDDDCENCRGWDMESNRCECGARRVYWDSFGFSFKNPSSLFATAD